MELGSLLAPSLYFVGFNALVVKDLKFKSVATFVEAGNDKIGGGKTVAVLVVL